MEASTTLSYRTCPTLLAMATSTWKCDIKPTITPQHSSIDRSSSFRFQSRGRPRRARGKMRSSSPCGDAFPRRSVSSSRQGAGSANPGADHHRPARDVPQMAPPGEGGRLRRRKRMPSRRRTVVRKHPRRFRTWSSSWPARTSGGSPGSSASSRNWGSPRSADPQSRTSSSATGSTWTRSAGRERGTNS